MKFPYIVLDQIDAPLSERWRSCYQEVRDRPRYVEEGLWRRTQDPANADQSGWRGPEDGRRRLMHYRYSYGLDQSPAAPRLVMNDLYVYHSVAYPRPELADHRETVAKALADGGWNPVSEGKWHRDDLRCTVLHQDLHPQDIRAGRRLPDGYATTDVVVTSVSYAPSLADQDMPWDVLSGGMRVKDRRDDPTVIADLAPLADCLPFQIEIGCGVSVEAGIPPLHRLHEIYEVTDREHSTFILDPALDPFLRNLLSEPERKLPDLTEMFAACFLAEPTPAHAALRALTEAGHLVGPVITNNFDGLTARAGLREHYVRRYDQQVPWVPFVPEARSLLVVGNHADRRKVQARARERGMKVFFLDPEGFLENGRFRPYPVEGAKDGDFLCRAGAAAALTQLAGTLGVAL